MQHKRALRTSLCAEVDELRVTQLCGLLINPIFFAKHNLFYRDVVNWANVDVCDIEILIHMDFWSASRHVQFFSPVLKSRDVRCAHSASLLRSFRQVNQGGLVWCKALARRTRVLDCAANLRP